MSNAWNFGINLWTMSFQTTSAICLHIIMNCTISKLEITTDFTYIQPSPVEHVVYWDTIFRNYWIYFPSIWLTKWRCIVCILLATILYLAWLIYIITTAMKSTAIFATKTDSDNRRSKGYCGWPMIASCNSVFVVTHIGTSCDLGCSPWLCFRIGYEITITMNYLYSALFCPPCQSLQDMYVCACMYIYVWYMYMYICVCLDDCNKLSPIIISYYVCEKEVTEIPQWSGKMITVTALCRWL